MITCMIMIIIMFSTCKFEIRHYSKTLIHSAEKRTQSSLKGYLVVAVFLVFAVFLLAPELLLVLVLSLSLPDA